jgi:quercetin dioxygenase-like cupin family protein
VSLVKHSVKWGILLGGITLGVGTVVGQQVPPTQSKGVQISAPESLDLQPWAGDMKGRELRIRKIVFQPGGIIEVHSHDDRPDASYLVQGELTELRAGGFIEHRPADTFHTAGKNVTHWVENRGTTPAVLIVVDIFKRSDIAPK